MEAWEKAYRQWRTLADRGYPERATHYTVLARYDARVRKAQEKYIALLSEYKAQQKNME